jgi:hypothetical protein
MCGLSYSEWLDNHQKIFGTIGDKAAFGAIVWKAAQNAKERANLHTSNSAMVPCCAYAKGGLCKLFIRWKCGSVPCQIARHQ